MVCCALFVASWLLRGARSFLVVDRRALFVVCCVLCFALVVVCWLLHRCVLRFGVVGVVCGLFINVCLCCFLFLVVG